MLSVLPATNELTNSSLAVIPRHDRHYHHPQPGIVSQPLEPDSQQPYHGQRTQPQSSRLLTLPAEIRLLIYTHLLALHPLMPRDLGPGYPVPRPRHCQRLGEGGTTYFLLLGRGTHHHHHHPAPAGYLPTSLLLACRQVYAEARLVPFHAGEFAFASWFFSGLSAGRAFVRGLAPWQRRGMRFARLELRVRDLVVHDPPFPAAAQVAGGVGGGANATASPWEELCGYWTEGLRGLRVKIEAEDLYGGAATSAGAGMDRAVWSHPRMCDSRWKGKGNGEGAGPWRWVDYGLRRLSALRVVEVELAGQAMETLGDEGKAEWCARLSERLNEGRTEEEKTVVLCASSAMAGRER